MERYELRELVDPKELTLLIRSFCVALRVAGGVVKNPAPGEEIPDEPRRFPEWRLTPVIGVSNRGHVIGGSAFCRAVRALSYGDLLCMKGDMTHAREAFRDNRVKVYRCPSAGLIDMVAPIRIGGHHLANVYFGQIRKSDYEFEKVWERYQDLKARSANASEGIADHGKLRAMYMELRTEKDVPEIPAIAGLLKHLADLISRKASRQAAFRVVAEISSTIVSSFDLKQGMNIILDRIGRAVSYSSGSILVLEGGKLVPQASTNPEPLRNKVFELGTAKGIITHIFKKCESVKCDKMEELKSYGPSEVKGSRELRGIQSFIGAPLVLDGHAVGVIELANKAAQVYTDDDIHLIELLAKFAALYLKSNRETDMLLSIAREKRDLDGLFRKIVKSVPKLVNGEGCSIFLRRHFFKLPDDTCIESLPGERQIKGLPAFLVETTELNRRLIGEAYYEPNLTDGLTGGVLFTGTPLNIPGGPGARKARLGECNWTGGKYASTDPNKTADYYANRPFLATPIKDSRGHVLGVIRVADAADGKTEFHENDVDIVTACAMQLGSALEANSTEWYFNQVLQEVKGLKSECAKQSGLGEIRRMIGKLDRQPLYMPLALPLLFFAVGVAGCGAVLTVVAAFRDIAWPWRITLISVTAVAFLVAYWAWRSYRSWQTKALRQSRVAHHRR